MSVDCCIWLPNNVRVRDVANVLGIAAGLFPSRVSISDNKGWYINVDGVSVSPSVVPTLAEIALRGIMVDGENIHWVLYHFEPDRTGYRLLMPKSTAFWITCGCKLVDFFGGEIDFQDCDEFTCNYKKAKKSNINNCPSDGKAWSGLQERIEAVTPITQKELEHTSRLSAYQQEGDVLTGIRKKMKAMLGLSEDTPDFVLADIIEEKSPMPDNWMVETLREQGVK